MHFQQKIRQKITPQTKKVSDIKPIPFSFYLREGLLHRSTSPLLRCKTSWSSGPDLRAPYRLILIGDALLRSPVQSPGESPQKFDPPEVPNMTDWLENPPCEYVFPIQNEDFAASHASFQGNMQKRTTHLKRPNMSSTEGWRLKWYHIGLPEAR